MALPPPLDFASMAGSARDADRRSICMGGVGKGVGNHLGSHHRHVAGFIATAMPTAMPSVMAPLMATNAACLIAWIMSLSPGVCIGQRVLVDAMNEL